MDRELILKIIGHENRVILEDQIFNTINILEIFREVILKKRVLSSEDSISAIKQLEKIDLFIVDIITYLDSVIGFTNSKNYLKKYLEDFSKNTMLLIASIGDNNSDNFTLHTNLLMDLALKY